MGERLRELEDIMRYREMKKAEDDLQNIIGELIIKYAIPGINYKEHSDFDYEVKETFKEFRGW